MDFLFLQLYIKKRYNQHVEEYFNVHKASVSFWRTENKIPPQRLLEFYTKEGTMDIKELFSKLYN